MNRIKITAADDARLRAHLLRGHAADEEAAFLLASVRVDRDELDLIVRDVVLVPDDALLTKHRAGLEIAPEFIARVLKRARLDRQALILVHSHPFTDNGVRFSGIDDAGEAVLFPRFQARAPDLPHAAIVFGQQSRDARVWLSGAKSAEPIDEIVVVGDIVEIVVPTCARKSRASISGTDAVARQVLAIGDAAQSRLGRFRVGLIGCGGIGSPLGDSIGRLGIGNVVTVDGDRIELHNVSRQSHATVRDVGALKAEHAAGAIRELGFGTNVDVITSWVQVGDAARGLLACDVVVVGTDTMKSRVFASRLGIQYAIPVVSVGIDIGRRDGQMVVGGHVAVQRVDGPCLDCMGLIDHEMLQRELMSAEVRRANPYIEGGAADAPSPSVVVFNQTLAGLAAAEVLHLATGALRQPTEPTYLVYDGNDGITRRVRAKAIRRCGACDQVRAHGDRYALPIEAA